MKNAGELLFHATNFTLSQLVYEDENKTAIASDLRARGIDYKIDNFIKVINGVMLRILEYGPAQNVTGIMFDLLTGQSRSHSPSQKTIYLIIKCISRVAPTYAADCRPDHVREYFIKINDYFDHIGLSLPLENFNPGQEKLKP